VYKVGDKCTKPYRVIVLVVSFHVPHTVPLFSESGSNTDA
jgi:hypothetical protein